MSDLPGTYTADGTAADWLKKNHSDDVIRLASEFKAAIADPDKHADMERDVNATFDRLRPEAETAGISLVGIGVQDGAGHDYFIQTTGGRRGPDDPPPEKVNLSALAAQIQAAPAAGPKMEAAVGPRVQNQGPAP